MMTLTNNEVIENNLKQQQENLVNIEQLRTIIAEMDGIAYSNATKARINQVANQFMAANRDYRGAMIKSALKKDLPAKIIMVCNINIKDFEARNERLNVDNEKLKEKSVIEEKRKVADALLDRVYPYKEEYIRGFSKISEGVRDWDCLVDLIEDSYVLEKNLIEYGIDLSVPPETF